MPTVIDILQKRGFIDQVTSDQLSFLTNTSIKAYVGFDPTSDSLHLGNLVGIIVLEWFRRYGHDVFALIGGATARIGDPSGKSTQRPFLDDITMEGNVREISDQLSHIFSLSSSKPISFVNNNDWYKNYHFIEFIRNVGRHFRVGTMLAKDSVKGRLNSEDGMSFTEFTYQILQAFDFCHLFETYGVSLQMGGSDQWGNITAGIEYIRKMTGKHTHGLTFPLLTRSDGKKFGKTEEGAIWLSPKKLSPYEFYQYLIRVPDADVIRLLKMLTFIDMEEILEIERQMSLPNYEPNTAQKRLARDVTLFVHGAEGLEIALNVTKKASPGSMAVLDAKALEEISSDMPSCVLSLEQIVGKKYVEVALLSGLVESKSDGVRLIRNQGAYINNEKVLDENFLIGENHLIEGKYLLLGQGKKKKILIKVS